MVAGLGARVRVLVGGCVGEDEQLSFFSKLRLWTRENFF